MSKPSKYGIHRRKFGGKLFKSYGIGNFFTSKSAAEATAKREREYGSDAKIVKVTGGWRLFLRDKPKRRK